MRNAYWESSYSEIRQPWLQELGLNAEVLQTAGKRNVKRVSACVD